MELGDKFRELDFATFEKIRKHELRPSYNLTGLRLLHEKALRERDLRELHRTDRHWGRAPYELLQNADDVGARQAVFILCREGLAFAHDGRWFSVENFRSLADGWSDKKPNECIGHKGLGFRSVLDITPVPHLFRITRDNVFGVKFSWALNNGHIEETLSRQPEFKRFKEDWARQGQPVCPIMAIPGPAKIGSSGEAVNLLTTAARDAYGPRLTTLFWFPAHDPALPSQVLLDLAHRPVVAEPETIRLLTEFIIKDVGTILPFLGSVEVVSLYTGSQCVCRSTRVHGPGAQPIGEVTVVAEVENRKASETKLFLASDAFRIPADLKQHPDTPMALKKMERAKVVVAARLGPEPIHYSQSMFHVYFPTEDKTGTGFTIHADFHVKPDRTHLMPGHYNEWLLEKIANLCSTTFLDQLLSRYRSAAVYETLAPTQEQNSSAGEKFVNLFSGALRRRRAPFVATSAGLKGRDEVVLPPLADENGFWASHFGDSVSATLPGKNAFLKPSEDTRLARTFLRLAGMDPLDPDVFLDLLEKGGESQRSTEWWYECYEYLAKDLHLSRRGHEIFTGRRILFAGERAIPIPSDSDAHVTLPPMGAAENLALPRLFEMSFVMLSARLAELLRLGDDTVEAWVTNRFRISRFEATEIIPRMVRRLAPQILTGKISATVDDLVNAWIFIFQAILLSRGIESTEFWNEVGRFPVLTDVSPKAPPVLVPAFLTFWPDAVLSPRSPLKEVSGLRRLNAEFFGRLQEKGERATVDWVSFFTKVGVSDGPVLRRYSRFVGEEDAVVDRAGRIQIANRGFQGERQTDENSAVLGMLANWTLEESGASSMCSHAGPKAIHTLVLTEGLTNCVEKALEEYHAGSDDWANRLWCLVGALPFADPFELGDAFLFCRGGGHQGHRVSVGNQVVWQLTKSSWLPSSHGPVGSGVAFARLRTRRLIGATASGEELGDFLLPYVVASNAAEVERIRQLGVDLLDDAASAKPITLVRALSILGERLSSEWGREHILDQAGRRRLVRGAIQEIYRALNQDLGLQPRTDLKLAIRTSKGLQFLSGGFYFADPGSAVERAFLDRLALIDVDRAYPKLFQTIGVTSLVVGQTVDEVLVGSDHAVVMQHLHKEIVEELSPFLAALLLVRAEPEHVRLVIRRLTERFSVLAMPELTVSLTLRSDPTIKVTTEFKHAYLQKHLEPGRGAVEEAHYALYVTVPEARSLLSIDGDALADELEPIFVDGISPESAGALARIVTRYQSHGKDRIAMERFLLEHLGVTKEAQEEARAILRGEEKTVVADLSPPPALLINLPVGRQIREEIDIATLLEQHQEHLRTEAQKFVEGLQHGIEHDKQSGDRPDSTYPRITTPPPGNRVTDEQQLRGRRGEEEIRRRLLLPGGWEGFVFLEDHREPPRGYDFLASLDNENVKLEVKTFTSNGQAVVTEGELREAALARRHYYLVGLIDDGGPPARWKTIIVSDPLMFLLEHGRFSASPELRVTAEALLRIAGRSPS